MDRPINVYYGEDLFAIEEAVKELIEKKVDKEWREFNLHIFDGGDANYRQIIDSYRSPPFAQGARVVVADYMSKKAKAETGNASKNLTELLKFVAKEAADTKDQKEFLNFLIVKMASLDKRLTSTKALESLHCAKEFSPLKGKFLSDWVKEQVKLKGKKIDYDAEKRLTDIVGSDRHKLSQEIDKIITYIDRRDNITVADVKMFITDTTGDVFSIINCIAENKKSLALSDLTRLLQHEHPLVIVASLITNFKNIYYIRLMESQNYKSDEIIKTLKIHPFIIKKAYGWKNIPLEQMKKALENLLDIELKLKSTATVPSMMLETWILSV